MVWWPWLPPQIDAKTSNTSGQSPGCCEVCNGYGMVMLGGVRMLCWDHYCAEMKLWREARDLPPGGGFGGEC